MRWKTLLALAAMFLVSGCKGMMDGDSADLVIVNARVWTGTGDEAQAVAVNGDRIARVGSNTHVGRLIGDETVVIDAEGRRLIPGITDSHMHLVGGGLQLARLQLRDVRSRQEFAGAVAAAARNTPAGAWVLGGRWSVESWDDPSPPCKEWLDPVTGETPVFLTRMDGHQGLANSAALRIAGIDRSTSDPEGGVIERDPATGEPTGILKDDAMDLLTRHIPPPSQADLAAALARAMNHANAYGITSIHDVSGAEDLDAMLQAHGNGKLTLRIRKYLSTSDWPGAMKTVRDFPVNDAWLCLPGFKGYMDGSLGSRTAYMRRPYADSTPESEYPRGLLVDMADPPSELGTMIEAAHAAGMQCAVHAIGDEANHILLDAYESVARKNGTADRRHRIEHAQHLLPEDLSRFAEFGVVASMQPYHKADDGRYAETALGRERLKGSYAFRSLIRSGAVVCFGSDWPVVTCDPFAGMSTAVTARTLDGKTWIPEESITIEEALRAYTVTPAWAAFRENELGTIEPGKLADMVILSQDVLSIRPDRIADTRAVLTIVGGRIVYDKR